MLHQFAVYVKHTRTNTKLIPLPIVNSACLHQHRTKFGKSQSVCTSTIPLPFTSPELYTQHHGKADLPKLNRWCQHRLYCGPRLPPASPGFPRLPGSPANARLHPAPPGSTRRTQRTRLHPAPPGSTWLQRWAVTSVTVMRSGTVMW